MSREQFDKLCAAFWPTAKGPDIARRYAVFDEACSQLAPDAIDRAVKQAIKTCKRMPSPAELIDLAVSSAPRSFGPPREVDGCPSCGGQPRQTVRDDGRLWRFYLSHEHDCQNPVFAKPAGLHWRDAWEQAGHKAFLPIAEPDKEQARRMIERVAQTLAIPAKCSRAKIRAGAHADDPRIGAQPVTVKKRDTA